MTTFIKQTLLLALFTALPASAFAAELLLDGKPVDPLCFTQWEELREGAAISAADCTKGGIRASSANEYYEPQDGFTGTSYLYEDDDSTGMSVPFIEYKYLGRARVDGENASGPHDIVLVRESGGGSGFFTTLYAMSAEDERLKLHGIIAGGDRCNGGIGEAAVEDGALRYTELLTPTGLGVIAEAGVDPAEFPGRLDDCAVCCYAEAAYEDNRVVKIFFLEELADFLAQNKAEDDPASEGPAAQACFDELVQARLDAGKTSMAAEELKAFGGDFKKNCSGP